LIIYQLDILIFYRGRDIKMPVGASACDPLYPPGVLTLQEQEYTEEEEALILFDTQERERERQSYRRLLGWDFLA